MNSNTKLIDERPLLVIPSLAKVVGLSQAVVLQQIHFLVGTDGVFVRLDDGFDYVWNTYEKWVSKYFIFWEAATLQKHILNLEKENLLISEMIYLSGLEKRKYYRINYDVLHARILAHSANNAKSNSESPIEKIFPTIEKIVDDRLLSDGEREVSRPSNVKLVDDDYKSKESEIIKREKSSSLRSARPGQTQTEARPLALATRETEDDEAFFSQLSDSGSEESRGPQTPIPVNPVSDERSESSAENELSAFNSVKQEAYLPGLAPRAKKRRKAAGNAQNKHPISDTAFKNMFELCFMAETLQQQLILDSRQRGRVASALGRLRDAEADLENLLKFKDWWAGTWMSKQKGTNQYQPPRPEQVVEYWFVAADYIKSLEPRPRTPQVVVHNEGLMDMMKNRAIERRGQGGEQ